MGITRFAALGVLLVLAGACSTGTEPDERPAAEAERAATTTTAEEPEVIARDVCGPSDGSVIEVDVPGRDPSPMRSELVVDGEVVTTTSDETPTDEATGPLTLVVPYVPDAFDPLTVMSIEGASVDVRRQDDGTLVGTDPSIEHVEMSCG
jgi:hypothetical protein